MENYWGLQVETQIISVLLGDAQKKNVRELISQFIGFLSNTIPYCLVRRRINSKWYYFDGV